MNEVKAELTKKSVLHNSMVGFFIFFSIISSAHAFQSDPPTDSIYIEVEDGTVRSPMQILTDDIALGDEYVQVEDGFKSSDEPPSSGTVTIEVTLSGGEYTLWGRTLASDESSDSFWIQVDDGTIYNWNQITLSSYWAWSKVHDWNNDNEVINWDLEAGTHEIKIYYREPNTAIDALFISNTDGTPTSGNEYYPPNVSQIKNAPFPWQDPYNLTLSNFQFEHPMTVINGSELEMVKHYIQYQVEPQYTAYMQFMEQAEEAQSFVPYAPDSLEIIGGYEENTNIDGVRELLWDHCHAAYTSALAYQLTGESRFADKAVEVMRDWSDANTIFSQVEAGLQLGSWFSQTLYAADLIYDYDGWTDEDRIAFKSWWKNNVLPFPIDVMRRKDNNWKDAGLLGLFTASVVLEDTTLLKEALIQLESYFYQRTDGNVLNPGADWKLHKDDNGVYLPREVVRNEGRSGITYTAYAMTSMVQCLEIARYAGFDMWQNTTDQGAGIAELLETYYQWDIQDQPFPWNNDPDKLTKRRNSYEIGNTHLQFSDDLREWIESNRPLNAREGDEYATLNKGDLHLSKLVRNISLTDRELHNPGSSIDFTIEIGDPYSVNIDQIDVLLDGVVQYSLPPLTSQEAMLIMPSTDASHEITIRVTDGFGVTSEETFLMVNTSQANYLTYNYDNELGTVHVEPELDFYLPGEVISFTAVEKYPYVFESWSGDVSSSDRNLSLTIDDSYTVTASFSLREDPQLNINFQARTNQVVTDYVSDLGNPYAYSNSVSVTSGWRVDSRIFGFDRTSEEIWDERKLSYIPMGEDKIWELEIANGTYSLELGFGDPDRLDHINSILLEDELITDPDGEDHFDVYTLENFEVTDGHLTISPADENVKINYLKIAPSNTAMTSYLVVGGGSGTGEYAEGEQAEISAPDPTGTDVFQWAGDTSVVADYQSNETFVTMPQQEVQVVATYLPYEEPEEVLSVEPLGNSLLIFPNPTLDKVTISLNVNDQSEFLIELLDLSGRYLLQETKLFTSGLHEIILDQELIKGVNVLRIATMKETITQVIIKK